MITKENLKDVLLSLKFLANNEIYSKKYYANCEIRVNFVNEKIEYPDVMQKNAGRTTTMNFSQNENFVVLECINRLLEKGYKAENIFLEAQSGNKENRGSSKTYLDILIKDNKEKNYLVLELKTKEDFEKHWNLVLSSGGQLFNYFTYFRCSNLCMYTSDYKNGKVEYESHLIILKDKDDYLNEQKKLGIKKIGYKDLKSSALEKDFYDVWANTYEKSFLRHGIFERNVEPFRITDKLNNRYSDLKEVTNYEDINKLYHRFATIMRQYNISGRENAFDKLVNLFLAKVYDEEKNKDALKFYWKGIAYDNYYDFQDRLQGLYSLGMKEALGEDVTYIKDSSINDAFKYVKNDPDATKDTIIQLFRKQKYFSNNDFAFLDVHNETLFKKNIVVLIQVVKMLEDIRLRTDEHNEFLGDLFEGFLDQGIKQSEGQFFTPLPIVRFIVSSLPLKDIIMNKEKPPVCLDYACGAGHFLNEYAHQIKSFVSTESLTDYYKNIIGVEKEYRLSKVSKVASFMYGESDIKITYADALAFNSNLKEDSVDILISNPPYSVKGFLSTLSDEEKEKYKLTPFVNEITNDSIEVFFLERTYQVLREGGIAAIILPSSVLTKSSEYEKMREILLCKFQIIAIVELGTGTFGKTGTTTVALFLKKRDSNPPLDLHLKNRIYTWFEGNCENDLIYNDSEYITKYCVMQNYKIDEYQAFLKGGACPNAEVFVSYKEAFRKQRKERDEMKFIKNIEMTKLFYFSLTLNNARRVVVVKSPTDSAELKKFLGYEWSSRKGSEGIKYIGVQGEKNDEIISKSKGIAQIVTPLFNPNDFEDKTKINAIIRNNFNNKEINITNELENNVFYMSLTELLDFKREGFSNAIYLNTKSAIDVASKFRTVKLKGFLIEKSTKRNKSKVKVGEAKEIKNGEYPFFTSGKEIYKYNEYFVDGENIFLATGGNAHISFYNGKAAFSTDVYVVSSNDERIIKTKYMYYYLESIIDFIQHNCFSGSGLKHLQKDVFKNIDIPKPPLDIQNKIIQECYELDLSFENSRMKIEEYREKIKRIFDEFDVMLNKSSGGGQRLGDLGALRMCKRVFKYETSTTGDVPFYKIGTFGEKADAFIKKEMYELYKSKYPYPKKGDVMISAAGTIGKVIIFNGEPSYFQDSNIVWIDNDETKVLNKFLYYSLKHIQWKPSEGSTIKRLYNSDIMNTTIYIPSLPKQKDVLARIDDYEIEIKNAESLMQELKEKRKTIVSKYLS